MSDTDELSAEELAYFESGGKKELSYPSMPAPADNGGSTGNDAQQPSASGNAGEQQADPSEAENGGDDDGTEVVEVKDGKARGRDGKFVSHKALHAEREKHKLTKSENQKLKEQVARFDERLNILNEAFNGNGATGDTAKPGGKAADANPLDEADIDPEVDIFAALNQQKRRNAYLAKQMRDGSEAQQRQQALSQVDRAYSDDQKRVRAATPDLDDALKHLVNGRLKELEVLGIEDPKERAQIINAEEMQIVTQALQAGRSPTTALYQLAKSRGYAGTAIPGAQQQDPANDAAQKIANLQNGKNASMTLSNVGGRPNSSLTKDALLNMSDEEFSAAIDSMSKQQVEKLLGKY